MSKCASQAKPLSVLQLTDSHLFANPQQQLLGITTANSLYAVTQQIKNTESVADVLLVTGDISQDSTDAAYAYLAQQTQELANHQLWVEGNHDEDGVMRHASVCQPYLATHYKDEYWQIIMLNSHVQHRASGYLEEAQLDVLKQALTSSPELYTLLVVHHHCLPVGSAWIDQIGLLNASELLALCAQYPQVKIMLSGHVHQDNEQVQQGITFLTTPSTCVQFKANSSDFAVDTRQPGYRWLELYADGTFTTRVERLAADTFLANPYAVGY